VTTDATALIPQSEQIVDFYGDGIPVAQMADGALYVALRPITDFLGIDFSSQRRRVLRDEVLAPRVRSVLLTAEDGRQREMFSLPLDLLPGWLFGVTVSKVRGDLVDKLTRYRADCFRVLWDAFRTETARVTPTDAPISGAALALEIATAVQHLARQQLEMEGRLADVAGRQEVMAEYLRSFISQTNQRLATLERHTAIDATIIDAQAAEISLAVKNVGQRLATRGDREGYARVYAELYRRYRISSYKNLPATHYEDVLTWLHGWYQELDSDRH
jgi:hypothetical protein